MTNEDPVKRFWRKVDKSAGPEGCWLWTGARDRDGYGQHKIDGKQYKAHRVAFWYVNGEISSGLFVCHRCDNPPCCNPAHLFAGRSADNVGDRHQKQRDAAGDRNGMRRHPGLALGVKNPAAKLTVAQVAAIRASAALGTSRQVLARKFNVTPAQIKNVVLRKNWRHIA